MNARDFFNAVSKMRDKQNEYFKLKTKSNSTEAKRHERIVDEEIKRVKKIEAELKSPRLKFQK